MPQLQNAVRMMTVVGRPSHIVNAALMEPAHTERVDIAAGLDSIESEMGRASPLFAQAIS
jgi:hypothetical protein